MDHAKDGKKKFRLSKERKERVVNRDLAKEKMSTMTVDDILRESEKISDADILKAAGKKFKSITEISESDRGQITLDLLEQCIGKEALDMLPKSEARLLRLFFFVGCGGHKSLNAFRYGVVEMRETWKWEELKGPCNLANKATDVAIQIATDNTDTEALARCVASCPRGGTKLTELAGALFRHKNHETGYQKKHEMFMQARKQERYGLNPTDSSKRFPDVSNTRYQSHSYAAAELVVFRDDYQELIEEICDGKTKSGTNHLEGNALKGLQDADTLCELGAMALEGLCCSWPYMAEVRTPPEGEQFVNALSPEMVALHRRIPAFCENLALHPEKIFHPNTPQSELTLDGKPFIDKTIIPALKLLSDDLPNLNLMISAMFRGATRGWSIFTPEYRDDPSDPTTILSLSPEMLTRLGEIPMTNDANEGPLGSTRVYIRFNPSKSFISKLCTFDDQLHVMRLARAEDASGKARKFREEYLRLQKERADSARIKQANLIQKKSNEAECLNALGAETDCTKILNMTIKELTDQFKVYKSVLMDPILANVTQSSMKKKENWLATVLAAAARILPGSISTTPETTLGPVEAMAKQLQDSMDMDIDDEMDEDMMDLN
ncbi:hypothetical protein BT96DRAFT_1009099 [Gymnopus androsaceus JB14]|uniref:Uncharacterized protein n=1 Tax=Gymnopus androsaceus JB14 TaxID=1447944 RepID=A0A6A4GD75_9AGAR|nr:hypothetical protein BT96DRAFT_1009099 [Gymnopus androsaceus JB14]